MNGPPPIDFDYLESLGEPLAGMVPAPPSNRAMKIEWFDDAVSDALKEAGKSLIESFLDEAALSVIYGDSNTGKTFVTLDMTFAVATGRDWNGHRVLEGLVIYVAAEGGRKIRRRLAALRKCYDEVCSDTGPKPLLALIRHPIDLRSSEADLTELLAKISEAEKVCGQRCRWIVVDTLSRALAGGDENSPVDMGRIVAAADRIRAETGAHFTYVHHTGKDAARGARGHSLLRAATDTEIEVTSTAITVTKQRDGDSGQTFGFRLVDLTIGTDEAGDPIKSAVVEWSGEGKQAAKPEKAKSVPQSMRMLLDVTRAAIEESGSSIRPFHDGPFVKAVSDEPIRNRYYARIAETPKDGDTPERLAERQRKNFNNALAAALKRNVLMAAKLNGERWIWLP